MKAYLLFAGLVFARVALADSQLQVTEAHLPESPVWGTNTATITLQNSGSSARAVSTSWQTRNESAGKGWGFDQDVVSIPAGETRTLPVEFIVPAFPGKVSCRIRIRGAADKAVIWERSTDYEFPFANTRHGKLTVPVRLQQAVGLLRREYPALRLAQRGRMVIYYLEGDAWVEGRIDAIAEERARIYRELTARINPAFDREIAIYLFPEADSKYAYTMHRGMGWASGRILVEIFNERERIDPYHEVTHIIAGSIGNPPAMLNEGLAAWSQEGHRWDGIVADSWAKAFAAHGALWPVEKLFSFTEIGTEASRASIAYPQSASLVGYLVDRFGWDKFLEAYRTLRQHSDGAAFLKAFGVSLDDVERNWLKRLSAPEIEPAPEAKVQAIVH